jgi:hypothetical protein
VFSYLYGAAGENEAQCFTLNGYPPLDSPLICEVRLHALVVLVGNAPLRSTAPPHPKTDTIFAHLPSLLHSLSSPLFPLVSSLSLLAISLYLCPSLSSLPFAPHLSLTHSAAGADGGSRAPHGWIRRRVLGAREERRVGYSQKPQTQKEKHQKTKNPSHPCPIPSASCPLSSAPKRRNSTGNNVGARAFIAPKPTGINPQSQLFFCAKVGACCTPGITLRPRSGMEEIRDIIHAAQPSRRASSCHGLATRYRARNREVKKILALGRDGIDPATQMARLGKFFQSCVKRAPRVH